MLYHYYDDLGGTYRNKFDAIKSGRQVKLYFYDKEFQSANWKLEPQENLSELYKQRAQQLRDKYDYIVLAYSGGIDSTNMLESFYYNNIHIDEIIMVGAFSQDSEKGVDENHNGEIYKNCFPLLNTLNLKNTKITTYDYTKSFDQLSTLASDAARYNKITSWYSPHHWWWHDIDRLYKKNGVKIGLVFGTDKPSYTRMPVITSKAFMMFSNLTISQLGNSNVLDETRDDFRKEFFYWSPEMPQILIKQLHMIDKFYVHNVIVEKNITYQNFVNSYFPIVERIIYNLRNPLNFVSQKSNNILSRRDAYILKHKNSDIYKTYMDHILWVNKNFGNIKQINGTIRNDKDIFSRVYFIS
jgi:hypothetical protein